MFFRTLNTVFKTILIYVPCLLVFSHFPHFCPAADFSLFFFHSILMSALLVFPCCSLQKSPAMLSSVALDYITSILTFYLNNVSNAVSKRAQDSFQKPF